MKNQENTKNEIMFKAWDKIEKKMIYFGLYSLLVDGYEDSIYWKRHYENALSDLEIMQFTGMHDKKGGKIFKGDIISLDQCDDDARFTIGFIEGAFCICGMDGGYLMDMHYVQHADTKSALIVGNIFSN